MPVVYIIGEKDPLVPLSDIYRAAQENPNSRVEVFRGCKHWSVKLFYCLCYINLYLIYLML